MHRAWWIGLAVGAAAIVGYFVVPEPVEQGWYLAIGAASVATMVLGIRRNRPGNPTGWYLLAGAAACFVTGDEAGNLYPVLTGHDVPMPSLADLLYLAGYPLLIAAVLVLARSAGIAATRDHYVDSAVVTLGALAVGWQPLVPSPAGEATDLLGRLVTAAYPVMDVGVLFIVVSAAISARASTAALRWVALSLTSMLAADVVFSLVTVAGTYSSGDPVDAGWLLSYVLLAVAALHPSTAATPVVQGAGHVHPRRWIVVVGVAAFVPLALLLARAIDEGDPGFAAPVGFSIATFALVGGRTLLLFGRVGRQSRELTHRAYHDDLTGLPNRAWIHDRLETALGAGGRLALCLADLDRFKTVNDTLGHRAGDHVLVAIGQRLRALTDDGIVVGRLGGDEFACVLRTEDPDATERAAQWIVDALREPIEVDGRRIQLSTSVGLALSDPDSTAVTLLTQADTAMYAAKAGGRDRWRRYEPAMGAHVVEQLTITNAFPDALREEQFDVVYQPVFTMGAQLKGFEALVRWRHPTLGELSPGRFVPLAEETGFVVALGRWVLDTACSAAACWPGRPTVAVNVSARQLTDPGIVGDVASALLASGLTADRLVVEVTESAIMHDVDETAHILTDLKSLGVVIAIDDFGTGHSSLAHLRDLPIDILKIDRSFVSPLADPSGGGRAFVQAIIGLARALGKSTVAEGVETRAQYETLRALGCDTVQGYLTGRPLAVGRAAELALATEGPTRRTLV